MHLGIDLMGGELPPQAIFEAALQVGRTAGKKVTFSIFAESHLFDSLKHQYLTLAPAMLKLEFIETGESVEMKDSPYLAIRRKKDSSISMGVNFIKEKKIDAFLTTGNTGALVGFATLSLPLLPGMERAALLVVLPTLTGRLVVLDVGANIAFKPNHLIEYARMGMAFAEICFKVKKPKIGLLNIGVEEKKGTDAFKEGFQLLQSHFPEHFLGNIEGRDAFNGNVDVLVTDGFTGNVFLKTCEGASLFFLEYLKRISEKSPEIKPALQGFHQEFNYSEYPGALLTGVDGLLIKCHGYSNSASLISGVQGALHLLESHFLTKFKEKLG